MARRVARDLTVNSMFTRVGLNQAHHPRHMPERRSTCRWRRLARGKCPASALAAAHGHFERKTQRLKRCKMLDFPILILVSDPDVPPTSRPAGERLFRDLRV